MPKIASLATGWGWEQDDVREREETQLGSEDSHTLALCCLGDPLRSPTIDTLPPCGNTWMVGTSGPWQGVCPAAAISAIRFSICSSRSSMDIRNWLSEGKVWLSGQGLGDVLNTKTTCPQELGGEDKGSCSAPNDSPFTCSSKQSPPGHKAANVSHGPRTSHFLQDTDG